MDAQSQGVARLVEALREARVEVDYMASGMTHAAWRTARAQEVLDRIDALLREYDPRPIEDDNQEGTT